jgi:hypothetical protein
MSPLPTGRYRPMAAADWSVPAHEPTADWSVPADGYCRLVGTGA